MSRSPEKEMRGADDGETAVEAGAALARKGTVLNQGAVLVAEVIPAERQAEAIQYDRARARRLVWGDDAPEEQEPAAKERKKRARQGGGAIEPISLFEVIVEIAPLG